MRARLTRGGSPGASQGADAGSSPASRHFTLGTTGCSSGQQACGRCAPSAQSLATPGLAPQGQARVLILDTLGLLATLTATLALLIL